MTTPVEFEPQVQTIPISPDKPGQVGGDHPAWMKHNMSFGNHSLSLWAPVKETSEIFETWSLWPAIYAANQDEIHKWAKGVFKDKSNIGKLSQFAKWALEIASDKIKERK